MSNLEDLGFTITEDETMPPGVIDFVTTEGTRHRYLLESGTVQTTTYAHFYPFHPHSYEGQLVLQAVSRGDVPNRRVEASPETGITVYYDVIPD